MPSSQTWAEPCRQLATRIREHCLRMTHRGRSGHVGSMLSMAEILAVLYTRVLRVDPQNPGWPDRDRFVLSKGHGGGAVYAVLGELGFFPKEWFEGKGVSWMGVSHQATEDIAIMRALPNMVVFCPCDFAEAEAGVHAMIAHDGPFYYRCGYKQEPPVHAGKIEFRLGQAIQVRDGSDATIFFTGTIGNQVLPAAEALDRHGIHCRVVSLHTVKPIDRAAIVQAARETGAIITVEEHQLPGGLGSAVAEVLCDEGVVPQKFLRIGLPDEYVSQVGTHEWLLDQYGLSAPKIAASVRDLMKKGKAP